MSAPRLRKLLDELSDAFWPVPGLMTLLGFIGGVGLVAVDRSGLAPDWLLDNVWIYSGGGAGARTLLGAIAASAIGVAGTVFSITIAALSLAAAQMGPRLLRNFVQDRGVQVSMGAFLGTFAFALTVLSNVRTVEEGSFTLHLSLTAGVLLAFACVGTLVYFVAHMASRINVDTVVQLVGDDVRTAMDRLTSDRRGAAPPPAAVWREATTVADPRQGYLQQIDMGGLADWAAAHGTAIRLLVRHGDHVFPGAPVSCWPTPNATSPRRATCATCGAAMPPSSG